MSSSLCRSSLFFKSRLSPYYLVALSSSLRMSLNCSFIGPDYDADADADEADRDSAEDARAAAAAATPAAATTTAPLEVQHCRACPCMPLLLPLSASCFIIPIFSRRVVSSGSSPPTWRAPTRVTLLPSTTTKTVSLVAMRSADSLPTPFFSKKPIGSIGHCLLLQLAAPPGHPRSDLGVCRSEQGRSR